MVLKTESEEQTLELGVALSSILKKGDVLLLHGELGAGKSVLTRGIALGMGISEPVTSPTFNIFNIYCGSKGKLYHFDLYRISDPDELFEIGFEDFISDGEAISVIEWPDIAKGSLPGNCIEVSINADGRNRYFDFREDNEFERKIKTIESIEDEYAVN